MPAIASGGARGAASSVADGQHVGDARTSSRAFEHGVDVSIHAATKYIGGHSDVMMGTITTTEPLYERVRTDGRGARATASSPDDAYLALRGLRTLGVRLERHQRNAMRVAEWLRDAAGGRARALSGARRAIRDTRSGSGTSRARADCSASCCGRCRRPRWTRCSNRSSCSAMGASFGGFESLAIPMDPRAATARATRWQRRAAVRCCGCTSASRIRTTSSPISSAGSLGCAARGGVLTCARGALVLVLCGARRARACSRRRRRRGSAPRDARRARAARARRSPPMRARGAVKCGITAGRRLRDAGRRRALARIRRRLLPRARRRAVRRPGESAVRPLHAAAAILGTAVRRSRPARERHLDHQQPRADAQSSTSAPSTSTTDRAFSSPKSSKVDEGDAARRRDRLRAARHDDGAQPHRLRATQQHHVPVRS